MKLDVIIWAAVLVWQWIVLYLLQCFWSSLPSLLPGSSNFITEVHRSLLYWWQYAFTEMICWQDASSPINVEHNCESFFMIEVYSWSTLLVVTAHTWTHLTTRLPVYMYTAIATCRLVNENVYTPVWVFSVLFTTQQNHEISDLPLHTPVFLQPYRHVLCMCVCVCTCECALACVCTMCVCLHVYLCIYVSTWPSVCGCLCIHEREMGGRETTWLRQAHTFNLIPGCEWG